MTLPSSGSISMNMIATELGLNLPLSLTDSRVINLAGKSAPPVYLPSDFYNKSIASGVLYLGGTYTVNSSVSYPSYGTWTGTNTVNVSNIITYSSINLNSMSVSSITSTANVTLGVSVGTSNTLQRNDSNLNNWRLISLYPFIGYNVIGSNGVFWMSGRTVATTPYYYVRCSTDQSNSWVNCGITGVNSSLMFNNTVPKFFTNQGKVFIVDSSNSSSIYTASANNPSNLSMLSIGLPSILGTTTLAGIGYNGTYYSGFQGNSAASFYYYSTTGSANTWTSGGRMTGRPVIGRWVGNTFLMGVINNAISYIFSSNSTTVTASNFANSYAIRDFAYSNGYYIVAMVNGIGYSTDAISWTMLPLSDTSGTILSICTPN